MSDTEEAAAIETVLRVFFPRLTRARVEGGEAGALQRFISPRAAGTYLAERLVQLRSNGGGCVNVAAEAAFAERVVSDASRAREALDLLRESLTEYPARVFEYFVVAAFFAKWFGVSMVPETDGLFPSCRRR